MRVTVFANLAHPGTNIFAHPSQILLHAPEKSNIDQQTFLFFQDPSTSRQQEEHRDWLCPTPPCWSSLHWPSGRRSSSGQAKQGKPKLSKPKLSKPKPIKPSRAEMTLCNRAVTDHSETFQWKKEHPPSVMQWVTLGDSVGKVWGKQKQKCH